MDSMAAWELVWIWQKMKKHFRRTFYQSPWYYTGFAFCQGHYWPHLIDEMAQLGLDKGGKGGFGFNKVEIDSKRLIGVVVFVCLFMSAPGASLTHFTFIFFLKVIVLSTSFYCRIVSGKSAWKPSGADLQIPPNWREKPLFYLFEKSSKPTTTNQTTQTGYQTYVPEYFMAPMEPSREICALRASSKISSKIYFRSACKAGSKKVISSKLNSNF